MESRTSMKALVSASLIFLLCACGGRATPRTDDGGPKDGGEPQTAAPGAQVATPSEAPAELPDEAPPDPHCPADSPGALNEEVWEHLIPEDDIVRAVGGGQIYHSDLWFESAVGRTPRDGGPTVILATGQPHLFDMAYYDNQIAWTSTGWSSPGGTLVEWNGTAETTLHDALYQPGGVDMDAELLCITDGFQDSSASDTGIGKLRCWDRSDQSPTIVAEGFARAYDVAIGQKHIFFTDPLRGNVHRMSRSGDDIEVFLKADRAQFLALAPGRLYVSSVVFSRTLRVLALPLDGSVPSVAAEYESQYFRALLADEGGFYVVLQDLNGDGDHFEYVTVDGARYDLNLGQGVTDSIAMDETRIYWSGSTEAGRHLRSRCRL